MSNFESIVELLKKIYEMSDDDISFMQRYIEKTRESLDKEIASRTRQKKGKKDVQQELEALSRFESVFKYISGLNACTLESLISQAEDLDGSVEITKLYAETEKIHKQVEELLQHQIQATKKFNSQWHSTRKLTAKQRRNEQVYTLWKAGKTVKEIKEAIDDQLRAEGEVHLIGRQTIYTLIKQFESADKV